MTINVWDIVTVRFMVHGDGMVAATILFWRECELFLVQIQDDTHQELIETLDAIWPHWTDQEQELRRTR